MRKDNVDIHCKEREGGNTAAHVAAINDHLEVLRFLADNGFNFAGSADDLCNA